MSDVPAILCGAALFCLGTTFGACLFYLAEHGFPKVVRTIRPEVDPVRATTVYKEEISLRPPPSKMDSQQVFDHAAADRAAAVAEMMEKRDLYGENVGMLEA